MALSIVLCDEDERYLVPLELKFTEEFGEKAEIIVITDKEYLKSFFSTPQNIDVLIINEDLYDEEYEKQDISNVFLLSEVDNSMQTENMILKRIYKYTSVKQIYNDVVNNMSSETLKTIGDRENNETEFIMVYSPSGGSGNTLVSMGIAGALSKCNKRVLFISTEVLQGFNYYLSNNEYISNNFEKHLHNHSENIVEVLKGAIRKECFDYLLPFRQATNSYNIKLDDYRYLLESLRKSGDYDYIVVDTSCELSNSKTKLMSFCHKVIVVTMQNKVSTAKLERLINNIDCSDRNKFMFICNKYMDSEVNYLIKNPATNAITIPAKSIIISPEFFSPLPSLLDLAFNVSFIDTTIVGISFKAPIIPPQSIIPAPIYLT